MGLFDTVTYVCGSYGHDELKRSGSSDYCRLTVLLIASSFVFDTKCRQRQGDDKEFILWTVDRSPGDRRCLTGRIEEKEKNRGPYPGSQTHEVCLYNAVECSRERVEPREVVGCVGEEISVSDVSTSGRRTHPLPEEGVGRGRVWSTGLSSPFTRTEGFCDVQMWGLLVKEYDLLRLLLLLFHLRFNKKIKEPVVYQLQIFASSV